MRLILSSHFDRARIIAPKPFPAKRSHDDKSSSLFNSTNNELRLTLVTSCGGVCAAPPNNAMIACVEGVGLMARLKDFALGLVLAAMGVAAFFQVFHVDPAWRFASIGALSAISVLAAAVFFVFAFSPRE